MSKIDLSVIVPVYNEELALPHFWTALKEVLDRLETSWEVVFVNDGSVDNSAKILETILLETAAVRIVNLSKNFGHEAALLAGIDHSLGTARICLDADLQHPPELIPEMLRQHQAGHAIVHMVREEETGKSLGDRAKSWLFYKLLNLLSPGDFTINASDFFLLDEKVCTLFQTEYRERARFLRGIIQFVGFSKTTLPFKAPERVAGESKYSFFRLLNFSLTALATFSRLPLRLGLLLGLVFGAGATVVGIYSLVMKMMGHVITGYTTIVVLLSFLAAIQLIVLGIIGEYVGYIFEEVKRRPIYVTESLVENHDKTSD